MLGYKGNIGRVANVGPGSFLWEIPTFSGLPKVQGIWFSSPTIHLAEMEWYLDIYPKGTKEFPDHILLRLQRFDRGPAKTFHCTLGVRRAGGEEDEVGTQIVKFGCLEYVIYKFDKGAKVCMEGNSGTLTLTFHIREEGETASQDKTSRENQTDVLGNTAGRQSDSTPPEAKGVMILSHHMKDLLENSEDCDVKIHVNDKEFPGHRCILKSRSPVFRMMLTHDCKENNSGVISIEDCDTETFEELMFYMYSGKTRDLTPTKAIHLYYLADKYSFPELKEQCVSFLKTLLSISNICDVILLSAKHKETDLFNTVTNFFAQNAEEILETVEWENFLDKHPKEANELYKRSLKSFHSKK